MIKRIRLELESLRYLAPMVLVLALAFLACGKTDSDNPGEEAVEAKEPDSASEEMAAAVEEEDLSSVTDCGSLTIAMVNHQPVYLQEVLDFTLLKEDNLVVVRPGKSKRETIREIREKELEKRIKSRLYRLEAASDPSVQPSAEEVETLYQKGVEKFGGEQEFLNFRAVSDPETLKSELALSIAFTKMMQKHVASKIEVTPRDKEQYYLLHRHDRFTVPAQAAVRVLFRFYEGEEEKQEEKEKIEEIRRLLLESLKGVKDKDQRLKIFSGFVYQNSEHKETRFGGGYWHIYGGHHIEERYWPLEDAAFAAEEDELSDILSIENGYCIFIVGEKKPAKQRTYAEEEDNIERILKREQYEQLSEEWHDSLYEKYDVKIFDHRLMCGVPEEATGEMSASR